ncbi:MAG: BON domain-containing protein [Methylophilaceae bacterium]
MARLLKLLILAVSLTTALNGCVPVIAGGAAAGGLAAADRRTSGAYVDDEGIEWKALTEIEKQLRNKVHVNVTSFNRNVLLTGEALDEETKKQAESITREIANVRNVTNEMQVGLASAVTDRSRDGYLTSLVKGKMYKENRFPPNYVKVVTEDSVVYLMGMVTRAEADDAVDIARSIDGVEKVVKVFEYVIVEE